MKKNNIKYYCATNKAAGLDTWNSVDVQFRADYGIGLEECSDIIVKYFGKQLLLNPTAVRIDMFCGYSNKFKFDIYENYDRANKSNNVILIGGTIETSGYFNIDNIKFSDIHSNIFTESYANRIIDGLNTARYNKHISDAGLNPDGINEVSIDIYRNYNNSGEKTTFTGSIFEIFDRYTSANDSMKYINGSYYRFTDTRVDKLYNEFLKNHPNFFLENAVRRGCIID